MKRLSAAIVGLAFVVAVLLVTAKPGFSFTEGKTIRIISGLPPGGGHDVEGRMVARWIGKYLPGKPRSIIKINMPGAAGLRMTAHIYNKAKRDGLTWAVMGTTQTSRQVLAAPQPYDLRKMRIIFSHSGPAATIVRDFLGVRKGEDIVKVDPSRIAVSGRTLTGSSLGDVLGLELLGIKGYKFIVGYLGSAKMALAFFSGEISYVGGTGLHHALGKAGLYRSAINEGKAFLLWQSGVITPEGKVIRQPGTDVPTIAEIYEKIHGKPPSGPIWEAYKLMGPILRSLNRMLIFPPGVPADRVATVREALRKLYSDPAYVKEWERIFGLKLNFIPGEEADKIARKLVEPSPGWDYVKNEFLPKLRARK
ncbi:MAG: hypothetical protein ACE5JU_09190 [Candidatus Binatia bacterium]